MARVIVPICSLRYPSRARFPLEAVEVLYQWGAMDDDDYTYTMRVEVFDEPDRVPVREALRKRLPAREAQRLIEFLDASDWGVSFFADSYPEG